MAVAAVPVWELVVLGGGKAMACASAGGEEERTAGCEVVRRADRHAPVAARARRRVAPPKRRSRAHLGCGGNGDGRARRTRPAPRRTPSGRVAAPWRPARRAPSRTPTTCGRRVGRGGGRRTAAMTMADARLERRPVPAAASSRATVMGTPAAAPPTRVGDDPPPDGRLPLDQEGALWARVWMEAGGLFQRPQATVGGTINGGVTGGRRRPAGRGGRRSKPADGPGGTAVIGTVVGA